MSDDFNLDSLVELYLYESTSLIDSLDSILLKAEADGVLTTGNIHEIFRIMHTIKGSSSMMAFQSISDVAHKTEDLVAVIRNTGLNPVYFNELFDILLAVSDFLKTEVSKLEEGRTLETEIAPLTTVVSNLTEKIRSGAAPEPESEQQIPDKLTADISRITARAVADDPEPSAKETYYLHIHFNEGSRMENIRAFMLVNKLSEKGMVNRTIPVNPEVNPEAINDIAERGFYVSFTTSLFRNQIETLIKGTLSVETVSFVRRMPDETKGTDTAPETLKPDPRPQPIATTAPTDHGRPQPNTDWRQVAADTAASERRRERAAPVLQSAFTPAAQKNGRMTYDTRKTPVFEQRTERMTYTPRQTPAFEQEDMPNPIPASPVPAFQDVPFLEQNPDPTPAAPPPAGQNIISVELKKLDNLLNLVGEIVINETIVTENPDLKGLELANFRKASRQLDKLTNKLQDSVMSIRMLPISTVFQRMRRVVRDMSKSLAKEANLFLVGEATEVDKTILDALSDPIMHLVRNAMDHAIESPGERLAAGKSASGHIILSAQNSGSDVIISISDDGRGLNKRLILNKARSNGLLRKPENDYTDREIYNILMTPGFTTRESVSEYSGRGVGLDVVKSNIEKIGGSIYIESRNGVGTNVIMQIPLTLAIISCIEIAIGENSYLVPVSNIRESFKSSAGQLITAPSGGEMIMLRGQTYPVIRLHELFGCTDAVTDIQDGILMLVDSGDRRACLLADRLIGKFQVVVKPLPTFLSGFGANRSGISGCTIMGNGNISLMIDVQAMINFIGHSESLANHQRGFTYIQPSAYRNLPT